MISQEALDLFIDVLAKTYDDANAVLVRVGINSVARALGDRLEQDYNGYTSVGVYRQYLNAITPIK